MVGGALHLPEWEKLSRVMKSARKRPRVGERSGRPPRAMAEGVS